VLLENRGNLPATADSPIRRFNATIKSLGKKVPIAASPLSASVLMAGALAAFVLAASLWALTREWDKPLLDLHSFRQTQTAISTYHRVGNPGVFLD
jgi:hypothetical protein